MDGLLAPKRPAGAECARLRARRARRRALMVALSGLLLFAESSRAFWKHWQYPYHQEITQQALDGAAGARTVATLMAENANTDEAEKKIKLAHFDSETFKEGVARLRDRLNQAVQELGECRKPEAVVNIARALHGLQDFYSHSIWVENQIVNGNVTPNNLPIFTDLVKREQNGTFSAGGLVANPNFLSTNKAPKPILSCAAGAFTAHGADATRLTTGYFPDNTPPEGKCSHEQINKDATTDILFTEFLTPRGQAQRNQNTLHRFAREVAARHTVQLFDDVLAAVRAKYPGARGDRLARVLTNDDADIAFLIDTAASMAAPLPAIKGAVKTVAAALGGANETPLLRLLTFKDTVAPIVSKCDPDEFSAAIDALAAAGGGNCPRASLTAVSEALKSVGDGGTLVVFTDASPREAAAVEKAVKRKARQKKVSLYFHLSGACPTGFAVYERLADWTGGYLFHPGAQGLDEWLGVIRDRAKPDAVHLLEERDTLTAQQEQQTPVEIDRSLAWVDFVLNALAGDAMSLAVERPGGVRVMPGDPDAEILAAGRLQVVRIAVPQAGTWKMVLSGSGSYRAEAFGGSNLGTTDLLFLDDLVASSPHPSDLPLVGSPVLGEAVEIEVALTAGLTDPVFQLVTGDGTTIESLSLQERDQGSRLFQGTYVPTSLSTDVFLRVAGTDSYGDAVVRVFPQPLSVSSLRVRPLVASRLTAPGCSQTFPFAVTNHGAADSFVVTPVSTRGFTVTPSAMNLSLQTGETANVEFTVIVPADAGAEQDELYVTATAVADDSITNTAREYDTVADCSTYCVDCAGSPITCRPAPQAGCRRSTSLSAVSLILKDKAGGDADRLLWKPRGSEATAIGEFGDPLATTAYSFCVYDQAGGSPPLLFEATAAAGGQCAGKSCWKPTGSKGFRYANKSRMPDGLDKLKLKAGEAGKASIAVLGKGEHLSLPTLPLALPVRVQLQAQDGECWEATYSAAGVVKNDAAQFKAKASSPGGAFLEP